MVLHSQGPPPYGDLLGGNEERNGKDGHSCVFLNDNKIFLRVRGRKFLVNFRLLGLAASSPSLAPAAPTHPAKFILLSITDSFTFLYDKVGELRSLFLIARLWRA